MHWILMDLTRNRFNLDDNLALILSQINNKIQGKSPLEEYEYPKIKYSAKAGLQMLDCVLQGIESRHSASRTIANKGILCIAACNRSICKGNTIQLNSRQITIGRV
eukprot:467012_1